MAELTTKHKLGGRVAMGHVTKVGGLPVAKQKDIARKLADAGVAVTALPATDLFVLARHVEYNVPRCVADLPPLGPRRVSPAWHHAIASRRQCGRPRARAVRDRDGLVRAG